MHVPHEVAPLAADHGLGFRLRRPVLRRQEPLGQAMGQGDARGIFVQRPPHGQCAGRGSVDERIHPSQNVSPLLPEVRRHFGATVGTVVHVSDRLLEAIRVGDDQVAQSGGGTPLIEIGQGNQGAGVGNEAVVGNRGRRQFCDHPPQRSQLVVDALGAAANVAHLGRGFGDFPPVGPAAGPVQQHRSRAIDSEMSPGGVVGGGVQKRSQPMDRQFRPFGQIQRVGDGGLVVLALRLEHGLGEHLGGLRPAHCPRQD